MILRKASAATAILLSLVLVTPTSAQEGRQASSAAAGPSAVSGPSIRAIVSWDHLSPLADDSFLTITGRTTLSGAGAGVEAIWGRVFVRAAVSRLQTSGGRVVVLETDIVRLGIPIELSMWPVDIGGGWRLRLPGRIALSPYAGAALALLVYREDSDDADPGEAVRAVHVGMSAFGGLDVIWNRWLSTGFELQARGFPGALGEAGVSAAFGETNLGGTVARIFFTIGRQPTIVGGSGR